MKPHILVVEDDATLRKIIAQTIGNAGYQVTLAADGATAIELLTRNGDQPPGYDVVITDIVMGDIDGVEVTTIARSQPDAPEVILLTGHGSLETSMAALRVGAFDYLLKPCRNTHLLERVNAALNQRDMRRRKEQESEAWQKVVATVSQVQLERAVPDPTPTLAVHPPEQQQHLSQPDNALSPHTTPLIRVGSLLLDTASHTVRFKGAIVHVTRTEYAILAYLTERAGQVVTFSDITRQTHGCELEEGEARELVRQHIRNLRKKIDRSYITSVYGVGYMLAEPS